MDSIASAQKLRDCTYIKGSLEIQIRGGSEYLVLSVFLFIFHIIYFLFCETGMLF